MFMIDRAFDMITPFMPCYTFEGLVDQFFDIQCNKIKVDNTILHPDEKAREELNLSANEKTELDLNSETLVYNELRDGHFGVAGKVMQEKLKEIQSVIDVDDTNAGGQTQQHLREFIDKVKQMEPIKAKNFTAELVNLSQWISD